MHRLASGYIKDGPEEGSNHRKGNEGAGICMEIVELVHRRVGIVQSPYGDKEIKGQDLDETITKLDTLKRGDFQTSTNLS